MLKESSILREVKNIYLIGIKGRGMSALASILTNLSIDVSGSDTSQEFITDQILKKLPVRVMEGFNSENIPPGTDLIISSVAYYDYRTNIPLLNNPEVKKALEKKIPILAYPQFLGNLFNDSFGIGICGTHGKTTTTAMIGLILESGGLDPTVLTGGEVLKWGQNSRAGMSKYFVLEADEYRESFLNYQPEVLVVGPINYDHPDFFNNFNLYKEAYKKIISQVKNNGLIIACGDNPNTLDVLRKRITCKTLTYGISSSSDITISDRDVFNGNQHFNVLCKGKNLGRFSLPLPGDGYLINSLASIGVALDLGIDIDSIRDSLKNYQGIKRRFEVKQKNPFTVIDDHAGLPAEIETTLKGAKEFFPGKTIWTVFQPHTFSRTEALMQDFAQSLLIADRVVILDIYAPAREPIGNVHSTDLLKLIPEKGIYKKTIPEAFNYLIKEIREGDVIITMGIGDVWPLADALTKNIK